MHRCSNINKVEKEAAGTRCGEEDPMQLCTTERSEAGSIESGLARCTTMLSSTKEKKAGKGGAVKEGSTKRRAAAGSSKGKKGATGPPAAPAAGGVPEGEEDAADVAMATAEGWVPGQLIELPKDYVDWILSQKRHVLDEDPDEYYARMMSDPDRPEVYTPEFLEEERQLMRDLAEQYRTGGDLLEEFQEWVRIQLKTKGRVLVDDTYLTQRIRFRQAFAEDWGTLWWDEDNAKKPGEVAAESN